MPSIDTYPPWHLIAADMGCTVVDDLDDLDDLDHDLSVSEMCNSPNAA